jgi:hypothetical protein
MGISRAAAPPSENPEFPLQFFTSADFLDDAQ